MSERVCHTMPGVREASSFVPEIGTQTQATRERRTRNIRRISEPRSERLAQPVCREFLVLFTVKKHVEKDYKINIRQK